jgi:hypothetical protein
MEFFLLILLLFYSWDSKFLMECWFDGGDCLEAGCYLDNCQSPSWFLVFKFSRQIFEFWHFEEHGGFDCFLGNKGFLIEFFKTGQGENYLMCSTKHNLINPSLSNRKDLNCIIIAISLMIFKCFSVWILYFCLKTDKNWFYIQYSKAKVSFCMQHNMQCLLNIFVFLIFFGKW